MKNMHTANKPMHVTFIDLEKAFNNINWEKLFNMMKSTNTDTKNR